MEVRKEGMEVQEETVGKVNLAHRRNVNSNSPIELQSNLD